MPDTRPTRDRGDARLVAALRAAQLYYMQDLTMDAIAGELGTSRSSVSRLLSYARESGLVEIQINSPFEQGQGLEEAVRRRFGVTAYVVATPSTLSDVDRLERVALTAARLVGRFIDSHMTVGVAWGSTMSAVSRHLPRKETHSCTIVQLNGAGNTETSGMDYASEILSRFGAAFSATVQQFPVPAFFDDPATKTAMWRERSTRSVLNVQRRMDVAVFGLGSPFSEVPGRVYVGGYLGQDDYRSMSADRVVGDIATVFYRADGTWKDVDLNARGTGPGFDRLRRVARRVCVVSGAQKVASLRGALAAGMITDLVLDESLARLLIDE